MIKHYLPHLPQSLNSFVEPFFGAGALFCHLWNEGTLKTATGKVVINDILTELTQIYHAIQNDVDSFIAILSSLESHYLKLSYEKRREFYLDLRKRNAFDYTTWSETQQAATQYFLFLTGFNGIFQRNKNLNGRFGTPCGLMKQTTPFIDIENIRGWHEALKGVVILNGTWQAAVSYVSLSEKDFVFLDPPYRDSFTSYGSPFSDADQLEVIDFCKATSAIVIMANKSGSDRFFEDNQGDLKCKYINTAHTAGRRSIVDKKVKSVKTQELILYNR